MSLPRPNEPYYFQANLIWWDSPFKEKVSQVFLSSVFSLTTSAGSNRHDKIRFLIFSNIWGVVHIRSWLPSVVIAWEALWRQGSNFTNFWKHATYNDNRSKNRLWVTLAT